MIEFKHVFKKYANQVVAVNDFNIKIQQGEFVYVIGPSGAGKSTFIKMMYREEKPTSGQIKVNDYQLEEIKNSKVPFLRRELGVVFQDFKLLPKLTIFENVAYALQVIEKQPAAIKARVEHVLGLVKLASKAPAFPNELSGGEQQRVAIARAIANEPKILIADEPTGNLDPETAAGIMEILERINQQGTTVVMATHNSHLVNEYRHRVIEIEGGRVIRDQDEGRFFQDEASNF
ncbi:cell division ATP-binding protein FtsE [Liquorilactobacillus satsumensis]|uniref:cell division ATP-binding protein FtsE n=1 Tax=Liquorilactobacillus satsumensis TaxID=259059 RepID=UPI0007055DC5|nr:cell division ATP-binding protein FtsE [Liquorilactobacillus satsumensis]MCC7665768.1 cell division ATP-binding protein FtsE [Liquorilactobacillus satsumensis]MCP9313429.1 cell division ATP-binding protein FtsE [Liquorilactobacillus satsumensis]MCP9328218.1 cell division ATP-binding protein FtsE [Liquorilactobacillus satsumensis]MCP9356437.1 cell division ATP-binding protein FtsE [Liquorilactobacillus satsumensis]MCP9360596.1 cell division ATP-binding protein FtsE [Liquorilactobacillus sats